MRYKRFQGLRAIAFLAIFVSHANIGQYIGLGCWGVSIFLCLSGFLSTINGLKKGKCSKKENIPSMGFQYVWNKLKKLYFLHLAMIFVAVGGIVKKSVVV